MGAALKKVLNGGELAGLVGHAAVHGRFAPAAAAQLVAFQAQAQFIAGKVALIQAVGKLGGVARLNTALLEQADPKRQPALFALAPWPYGLSVTG